MSTLKELLKDVPVEWKALGDVLNRSKGTKITAEQMKVLHKEGTPLKIFAGGKTVAFCNYDDIPEKDINYNPSIIVKSRGIIEFEYYDMPFSHKNEMWSYYSSKNEIDIKYVYYLLKINESYFQNIGNRMQMPQISTPVTDKFQIPIPYPNDPEKSLEIQQEIVRFLDGLSEQNKALTSALALEIDQRKKQYAYYREELFRFEGKEVEWKTLGDVANIGTGSHDTKDAVEDGLYTFYARGVNPLKLNSYDFDETAIITAGDGVGVGKVFHWVEGKYALHQRAYKIVPFINVNPRYIYYYVLSNFLVYVEKQSVHSSVTSLRKPMFLKFPVAIPSIDEQKRIVRLLDQFDEATKSIAAQLEKESELRNKQYEYYRNLLLSFPKEN